MMTKLRERKTSRTAADRKSDVGNSDINKPVAPGKAKSKTARATQAKKQSARRPTVNAQSAVDDPHSWLANPIEFIASDEFCNEGVESEILAEPNLPANCFSVPAVLSAAGPLRLENADLLVPAVETHLFRKMNFLKWRAEYLRSRIRGRSSSAEATIREIERLLTAARDVRDQIVRANLRLVVFVAKRFVDAEHSLAELVSDGNMSLLRAVEKFDYTRGFRFSTYATWALRYNLARMLANHRQQRRRFATVEDHAGEILDYREPLVIRNEAEEQSRSDTLRKILQQLDSRERAILAARFGLGKRTEELSLKKIADELGICKERVRQLQIRALDKLRALAVDANLRLPDE